VSKACCRVRPVEFTWCHAIGRGVLREVSSNNTRNLLVVTAQGAAQVGGCSG